MWINRRQIYTDHAQLPTPIIDNDNLIIFYSHRIDGKSYIGQVIFDKELKIIEDNKIILSPGKRGCFDDSGVMPSFVEKKHLEYRLYYSGWNLDKGLVPYGHGIGQARGIKEFDRYSEGPLLDRNLYIPYLANSPFILNNIMYFCNGCGWDGDFPKYKIAINDGKIILDVIGKEDEANSRPCILFEDGKYKLWSAVRTKTTNYRIRYFEKDFEVWSLIDDNVLPVSQSGWDSEMVCYPYVIDFYGRKMLYNGNGYGTTGFGISEWSQ